MKELYKDYDIELILSSINACQSIQKGCDEAQKSISTLMTILKKRNQILKKEYFAEKINSKPYTLVFDIDLKVILRTLNKTKNISLAELELGICEGYIRLLLKSKGYKLAKRWVIADL